MVIGKMVREEGAWVVCVCISYTGDGGQLGSSFLWNGRGGTKSFLSFFSRYYVSLFLCFLILYFYFYFLTRLHGRGKLPVPLSCPSVCLSVCRSVLPSGSVYQRAPTGRISLEFAIGCFMEMCHGNPHLVKVKQKYGTLYVTT